MTIALFEEILMCQAYQEDDEETRAVVIRELDKMGVARTVDEIGNIIATKGEGPYPTVCAHLDTVHQRTKDYQPYRYHMEDGDITYDAPTGIGGDDKCGIYGVLELLRALPNIRAVFFVQEECGTIGAYAIDLEIFEDSAYLIELDRRGDSDVIATLMFDDTVSEQFTADIMPVMGDAWDFADGTFTDVMILAERGVGLSAINVSCGYHNAHTAAEWISWKELCKSVAFVFDLVIALGQTIYPHEMEVCDTGYTPITWTGSRRSPFAEAPSWGMDDVAASLDDDGTELFCPFCCSKMEIDREWGLLHCLACDEIFSFEEDPICPGCESTVLEETGLHGELECFNCGLFYIWSADGELYEIPVGEIFAQSA